MSFWCLLTLFGKHCSMGKFKLSATVSPLGRSVYTTTWANGARAAGFFNVNTNLSLFSVMKGRNRSMKAKWLYKIYNYCVFSVTCSILHVDRDVTILSHTAFGKGLKHTR